MFYEPGVTTWKVVDGEGVVLNEHVTYTQANVLAEMYLTSNPNRGIHIKAMVEAAAPQAPQVPLEAIAGAEKAAVTRMVNGGERDALREAIEAEQQAAATLDERKGVASRAAVMLTGLQTALDKAIADRESRIAESGAELVAAMRSGGAAMVDSGGRLLDIASATFKRDAAQSAKAQIDADLKEAEAAHVVAESQCRLAVRAVMSAEAVVMVERLKVIKAEMGVILAALDTLGLHGGHLPFSATSGIHDTPYGDQDAENRRWGRFAAALRADPATQIGELQ
ncbi:hypothetical protein OVY01_13500 [Robbsia sp. Bb-Pol-6]|uniref:Uncharacterized protein n=1 Tax=Robbsia betulipollinis TaxID=2981849 RepID=A0ABT3ZNW4_9BURK|nr:hypothetical protein [Robbsia betulipollinis]MCY0388234.1 hypothetical protein [Robbsia betulipollinis]